MDKFEAKIKKLPKNYQEFAEHLRIMEGAPFNTRKSYLYCLTMVMRLIGKDLLMLDKKQIGGFLCELKEKNKLKSATRSAFRAAMHKFYAYAVEQKLICENPMPSKFKDPIIRDKEIQPLNQKHLEIIQRVINERVRKAKQKYENNEITETVYAKELSRALAICFLIDLGPRVSVILKIYADDLELDERVTPYQGSVRETVSFVKLQSDKNSPYKKTSEPLDEATVDILKEYMEVADADVKMNKKPLICHIKNVRSIQQWCQSLKDGINKMIEKEDICCPRVERLTPHSFRRSVGTLFGMENPAMAQKKLNHRDARSLMSYFYPSKEEKVIFRNNILKARPRPEKLISPQ